MRCEDRGVTVGTQHPGLPKTENRRSRCPEIKVYVFGGEGRVLSTLLGEKTSLENQGEEYGFLRLPPGWIGAAIYPPSDPLPVSVLLPVPCAP